MTKRRFIRLLTGHLLNKKIKLYRKSNSKHSIRFKMEFEGGYLQEYFLTLEDALLLLKVNKGNLICSIPGKVIVLHLMNGIYCVIEM